MVKKVLSIILLSLVGTVAYADPNKDLWRAAGSEDLAGVEKAIAEGAEPNFNEYGTTPLIRAAMIGPQETVEKRLKIAQYLIDKGADVNGEGKIGSVNPMTVTPLSEAIKSGQVKMVELLLSQSDIRVDESVEEKLEESIEEGNQRIEEEKSRNPEGSKYLDYLNMWHNRNLEIQKLLTKHLHGE